MPHRVADSGRGQAKCDKGEAKLAQLGMGGCLETAALLGATGKGG